MDANNEDKVSTQALLEKVGPALETINLKRVPLPKTFTCENGVVLALRKVSGSLLTEAARKLQRPEPEEITDEVTGRKFKNETSPAYLDAVDNYMLERAALVNVVYLGFGTKLESKPNDVPGPDDTTWEDEFKELLPDLTFAPVGTKARYVAWVRNVALNDDDHRKLLQLLQGFGEVTEADVQDAMASFRRDEARPADNGASNTTESRA